MICPKTCARAPNIVITQELLDKDALPWKDATGYEERLDSVLHVGGKDVALVFVKNRNAEVLTPFLKCACDFHYEDQGNSRMHYIDTHRCKRKKDWYQERTKGVGREYNDKGMTPKEIILDIFDRAVYRGEFLGQQNGDWIYVQHIAEMFIELSPTVWGHEEYPLKQSSAFAKEVNRKRYESMKALNATLPEGGKWKPSPVRIPLKDLAVSLVLKYVRELYKEEKVSLDGMVLVPYVAPPPEISDDTRTMMYAADKTSPMLVWADRAENFQAEVQRIDRTSATLCLFDHADGGKLVKTWRVGLMYGAEFGPDVDDVAHWGQLINGYLNSKPVSDPPKLPPPKKPSSKKQKK